MDILAPVFFHFRGRLEGVAKIRGSNVHMGESVKYQSLTLSTLENNSRFFLFVYLLNSENFSFEVFVKPQRSRFLRSAGIGVLSQALTTRMLLVAGTTVES